MKPITNILLVLAIMCYAFLPLFHLSFQGSVTGFSFTAGIITQQPTAGRITFALLPFLSTFLAVGFNTLRNRWWGLASVSFILLGLYFFLVTHDFQAFALNHAPDVTPSEDIGEGFRIVSLGAGYVASCTLMVLSLISAILSVLPFDFNFTLERAVDQTIDRSIEDVKHLGARLHHHGNKKPHSPAPPTGMTSETSSPTGANTPPADPEDHSRFMPK
ncbi:MAG: hypothetical protein IJT30_05725 [Muribaculaceae bacterium]|nr:hypothetical protein [Muribaculaceae bacterium]